jgi:DNA-binding HxlR family transcriptional regulator
VETYRQFCPLAKAAEILCERWTPLVLRELLLGSTRFNELQRGLPGMSPSLLSARLRSLERAGILRAERNGRASRYVLTEAGAELEPLLTGIAIWGHRWVRSDYADEDLDSSYLVMDIRRAIRDRPFNAPRRVVVELALAQRGATDVYWLVAEPGVETDLCYLHPSFDVDVRLEASTRALAMVWMGDLSWQEALHSGRIELVGPPRLTAEVPAWIGQHDLAAVERAR